MPYATVHLPYTNPTLPNRAAPTSHAASPPADYAMDPTVDATARALMRRIDQDKGSTEAINLLRQLDRINLMLVSDNTLQRIALWSATGEGE